MNTTRRPFAFLLLALLLPAFAACGDADDGNGADGKDGENVDGGGQQASDLIADGSAADVPAFAKYVPEDTVALAVLRTKIVLQHELFGQLRQDQPENYDEMVANFADEFGLPFDACEVAIFGMLPNIELDTFGPIPQQLTLVVFDKPLDQTRVLANDEGIEWEEVQSAAGSYWKPKLEGVDDGDLMDGFNNPAFIECIAFPADNIYLMATQANMESLLSSGESEWSRRVAKVPQDYVLVGWAGRSAVEEFKGFIPPDLPPQFANVIPLLESIELVEFAYQELDSDTLVSLSVKTGAAADATAISEIMTQFIDMGKGLLSIAAMSAEPDDPAAAGLQVAADVLNTLTVSASGNVARLELAKPADFSERYVKPLAASVAAARDAAQNTVRANKLRMTAIAAHMFHDVHGQMPPGDDATRDDNGRPLLSWRVHLLPYLDQEELYLQFHLDEPWDSEHNQTLLAQMPDVFALNPDLAEGMTDVIAPYGDGTPLGGNSTLSLGAMADGVSNTILVVEAAPDHAVPWTKPDDFQYDPNAPNPVALFGQPGAVIFQAAMADASVRPIRKTIAAEVLGWLFTYNDGNGIDWNTIR